MTNRKADDWTIERWKTEPRLVGLEFSDAPTVRQAPPLWKDLAWRRPSRSCSGAPPPWSSG